METVATVNLTKRSPYFHTSLIRRSKKYKTTAVSAADDYLAEMAKDTFKDSDTRRCRNRISNRTSFYTPVLRDYS